MAPSSNRIAVLLPAPLGPRRQTREAAPIDQLTSSSASVPLRNRLLTPLNATAFGTATGWDSTCESTDSCLATAIVSMDPSWVVDGLTSSHLPMALRTARGRY